MKKAKRWIVSAGACLLALTGMSVSFGQIPTAPIPEQNNDGLPLLTEPAPIDVAPIEPLQAPTAPADVPAPAPVPQKVAVPQTKPTPAPAPTVVSQPAPAPAPAPAPVPAPQQATAPQAAPAPQAATPAVASTTQQPCRQCNDPCQQCPDGAYYSPSPYYGTDTKPWWMNIHPVPYTPAGHEHMGIARPGFGLPGVGGRFIRDRYGRMVPIEPPFYTTRGPRDFYLDNPRPLGY